MTSSLVAAVATARNLSRDRALEVLLEDALLSQDDAAHDPARSGAASWQIRAALASDVLQRWADEAHRVGPPTDHDLETVNVVHAVVLRTANVSPTLGTQIAESIRAAVRDVRNPFEFEKRAAQVPHGNAQVTIERVGGFDAAGDVGSGGQVDADFVAASFELTSAAPISPVVETPFGWHVIGLVERVPADAAVVSVRRESLGQAVVLMHLRSRVNAVLRERRGVSLVRIEASSEAQMARAVSESP